MVFLNDLMLVSKENAEYSLMYDSVHGKSALDLEGVFSELNAKKETDKVMLLAVEDPTQLPQVDILLEMTGNFNDVSLLQPLNATRILVSAPVKGVPNVVVGVNEALVVKDERIITAASCTTNCIAPVIHALDEGKYHYPYFHPSRSSSSNP